jgi:hypothetical protein
MMTQTGEIECRHRQASAADDRQERVDKLGFGETREKVDAGC